jgi:hypothetical protein
VTLVVLALDLVTTIAGSGTVVAGSATWADGAATAARFNNPSGVFVGSNGVIYVADSSNNRIRRIEITGVFLPSILWKLC